MSIKTHLAYEHTLLVDSDLAIINIDLKPRAKDHATCHQQLTDLHQKLHQHFQSLGLEFGNARLKKSETEHDSYGHKNDPSVVEQSITLKIKDPAPELLRALTQGLHGNQSEITYRTDWSLIDSEPARNQLLKEALEILNKRATLLAPTGQVTLVELDLDRAAARFKPAYPDDEVQFCRSKPQIMFDEGDTPTPALKPESLRFTASIAAIYELA